MTNNIEMFSNFQIPKTGKIKLMRNPEGVSLIIPHNYIKGIEVDLYRFIGDILNYGIDGIYLEYETQ